MRMDDFDYGICYGNVFWFSPDDVLPKRWFSLKPYETDIESKEEIVKRRYSYRFED